MTEAMHPLTYTVEQAAALLGIGRNQLYEAVNAGNFPSFRIGRRILIPRVAVERLLGSPIEAAQEAAALAVVPVKRKQVPTVGVALRVPADLCELIDGQAADAKRSRSAQIMHLLRQALGRAEESPITWASVKALNAKDPQRPHSQTA